MKGRLARLGHGKNGRNDAATIAPPKAIIAVVSNRSLLCRNTAFQPAWKKAVDKTSATIHALTMISSFAFSARVWPETGKWFWQP